MSNNKLFFFRKLQLSNDNYDELNTETRSFDRTFPVVFIATLELRAELLDATIELLGGLIITTTSMQECRTYHRSC